MNKKLAYDIGAFDGDTTDKILCYYDNIVCIDANPHCINELKKKYKDNKNVSIVHGCISNSNEKQSKFYISKIPIWSSIYKEISNRLENENEICLIDNININDIIDKYGMPEYMKIDIEGADILVLNQLKETPKYISCESECIGNRNIENDEDVKVLNKLKELGYNKFFLYNNHTNQVNETNLTKTFSECIDFKNINNWISYNEIYKIIKSTNRTVYNTFNFWCDIFATK